MPASKPIDLAQLLLPDRGQTLLLRCCVGPVAAVAESWDAWSAAVGDVKGAFGGAYQGQRWLLPLLHDRLAVAGAGLDDELHTYMRVAAHRESLRTDTYRRVLAEVLSSLGDHRESCALIGDVALAETVYDQWSHRHCSSIDLHCAVDTRDRLGARLRADGLTQEPTSRHLRGAVRRFTHRSGVPVLLWSHVTSFPVVDATDAALTSRRRPSTVGEHPVEIADATALLFITLAWAASRPQRDSLAWVIDASSIASRESVEGAALRAMVSASGLTPLVESTLGYLEASLGVSIPVPRSAGVDGPQVGLSTVERDVCLSAIQQTAGVDARTLMRDAPQLRPMLARSLLHPAPGYLGARYGASSRWQIPLLYLVRLAAPIRGAAS